jgi:hypothetical protein
VVNASLRWLNNVRGKYLTQVFLLLNGQQDLVDFFRYRPLLPIGWRIVQILRQRRGKQQIQHQLLLVQYKQQANPLISMDKYTPLVISRNDKNNQLILIKPTKIGINRNK